jgi:hypothetical protein
VSRKGKRIHENAYAASAAIARGSSVDGIVMSRLLRKLEPKLARSRTVS